MTTPRLAFLSTLITSLMGCASAPPTQQACADISGTYSNASREDKELLSALFVADDKSARAARSVRLDLETASGVPQLTVKAGGNSQVLRTGADFVCSSDGVRLVRPVYHGISLGSVFSDSTETIYTLVRTPGGSLSGAQVYKQSSVVGGMNLSGRERDGTTVVWDAAE